MAMSPPESGEGDSAPAAAPGCSGGGVPRGGGDGDAPATLAEATPGGEPPNDTVLMMPPLPPPLAPPPVEDDGEAPPPASESGCIGGSPGDGDEGGAAGDIIGLAPAASASSATSITAARPKSAILSTVAWSVSDSSRFSGLRSRWHTPCAWQNATPDSSCRRYVRACRSSVPSSTLMRSKSSPPDAISSTRNSVALLSCTSSKTSKRASTFGWRSSAPIDAISRPTDRRARRNRTNLRGTRGMDTVRPFTCTRRQVASRVGRCGASSRASGGSHPHSSTHLGNVSSRSAPKRESSYAAITARVFGLTSHQTCASVSGAVPSLISGVSAAPLIATTHWCSAELGISRYPTGLMILIATLRPVSRWYASYTDPAEPPPRKLPSSYAGSSWPASQMLCPSKRATRRSA
mmetsp:Transcript_3540/g.12869  ORF Transcript_3540/g.12869 Transcript_3540/m.12869 type:complete len:406 (-) Transcript_3540:698-1915(-)